MPTAATLRQTTLFAALALGLAAMPAFAGSKDMLLNPHSLSDQMFASGAFNTEHADTSDPGAVAGKTIVASDAVWSPAYYHSSDARLKVNVHPIDNALDRVLKMRGVEFNWKKDGHADMGVVAQDVALAFPDAVMKDDKGMMAVEYDSLVGPMIEAIRELKKENEDLRKQVSEMDNMKAQMERISGMVLDMKRQNAQLRMGRSEGGEGHGVARPSTDSETP